MGDENGDCISCRWWRQIGDEYGWCRRYPPIMCESLVAFYGSGHEYDGVFRDAMQDPNVWAFPVSMIDDSCGEWTERIQPKNQEAQP